MSEEKNADESAREAQPTSEEEVVGAAVAVEETAAEVSEAQSTPDEPAPPTDSEPAATTVAPPAPPRRHGTHALARAMQWLPVLPLLIFPLLFLITSLGRINVPFELEWNEGQSAEQSWRFAKGLPLYPKAEENWVPYMYAPLYHMAHGAVMRLFDWYSLVPGRWISFLSTLLTVAAIVAIVRDRSRGWAPAVMAGMLYFAYYKPTGFWFDIVRVDAMAFMMVAWGVFFVLKRRPKEWQVFAGLVLLGLATWAKQTNGVIAVACGVYALVVRPRAAVIAGLLCAWASANMVFVFLRGGSSEFLKYVYTNALNHPSANNVWFPKGLWADQFLKEVPDPASWTSRVSTYIQLSLEGPAAPIWNDGLRHIWLLMIPVVLWLVLSAVRLRVPRGWFHLVIGVLLSVLGLQSVAKYGGYINNYLPVYMATCILAGLAMAGLMRLWRNGWWSGAVGLGFAVLLTLQITQPWRLPPPGLGDANWSMMRAEPNSEIAGELRQWSDYLYRVAEAEKNGKTNDEKPPEVSAAIKRRHTIGRWNWAGLTYFPSHQQPAPGSMTAHLEMMGWLRQKERAGEPVFVMHHQFYGLQTGHPMAINIDMVRCAVWAGDPIPEAFRRDLSSGKFKWVVLGRENLEWDWLAGNIIDTLKKHYEYVGPMPALRAKSDRVLHPVTGADMRPLAVYRFKGFKGKL